ncbi:unnamed protein product, partial [Meganyctiphanes norvegica]
VYYFFVTAMKPLSKTLLVLFISYTSATNDRFVGPHHNTWTNAQCPVHDLKGSRWKSLTECQTQCVAAPGCNAINYGSDHCIIRVCPLPIPLPQGHTYAGNPYKGYSLITGT